LPGLLGQLELDGLASFPLTDSSPIVRIPIGCDVFDPFGQRQYDAIKAAPEGRVIIEDYDFPKPGTSESVPKESYMTRVGDQGCGVGYYK
jgi:hypothetical protein